MGLLSTAEGFGLFLSDSIDHALGGTSTAAATFEAQNDPGIASVSDASGATQGMVTQAEQDQIQAEDDQLNQLASNIGEAAGKLGAGAGNVAAKTGGGFLKGLLKNGTPIVLGAVGVASLIYGARTYRRLDRFARG